ncbi:phage tail assembly chaperone [Propionivibrio sp.]|uniref:phage tail assembly chaperone n=1 Tax=Propionivibrio sp. TaxID=2212460 RepID=UPI003BF3BBF2
MFKLEPNPTFFAPVSIHVPGQGLGTFEAEFRHLAKAERDTFHAGLGETTNLDALAGIVTGWRGIDAPFSRDNLERLLDEYQGAVDALFKAYFTELYGAAVKN